MIVQLSILSPRPNINTCCLSFGVAKLCAGFGMSSTSLAYSMHMHFNHNNYGMIGIMISTLGNELQHDKAQCRSIKMANKIRRIPLRTSRTVSYHGYTTHAVYSKKEMDYLTEK